MTESTDLAPLKSPMEGRILVESITDVEIWKISFESAISLYGLGRVLDVKDTSQLLDVSVFKDELGHVTHLCKSRKPSETRAGDANSNVAPDNLSVLAYVTTEEDLINVLIENGKRVNYHIAEGSMSETDQVRSEAQSPKGKSKSKRPNVNPTKTKLKTGQARAREDSDDTFRAPEEELKKFEPTANRDPDPEDTLHMSIEELERRFGKVE